MTYYTLSKNKELKGGRYVTYCSKRLCAERLFSILYFAAAVSLRIQVKFFNDERGK